jgi:hypothetical protein
VEKEDHYYNAKHTKLIDLGLEPHLLSETLVGHVFEVIERHRDRLISDHILPRTTWRGGFQATQQAARQPVPAQAPPNGSAAQAAAASGLGG